MQRWLDPSTLKCSLLVVCTWMRFFFMWKINIHASKYVHETCMILVGNASYHGSTSHDHTSVCLVCMSVLLWVKGMMRTRKMYCLACRFFFFSEILDVSKHYPIWEVLVCVYTAPTCAPVILGTPLTKCAHMSMHTRAADWCLCA